MRSGSRVVEQARTWDARDQEWEAVQHRRKDLSREAPLTPPKERAEPDASDMEVKCLYYGLRGHRTPAPERRRGGSSRRVEVDQDAQRKVTSVVKRARNGSHRVSRMPSR